MAMIEDPSELRSKLNNQQSAYDSVTDEVESRSTSNPGHLNSQQSDYSSVTDKKQSTLTDKQKAWLIYALKLTARLAISGGMSAVVTQSYDVTDSTPISTQELTVNIMSNVVFLALDYGQKGILDNAADLTDEKELTPVQMLKSFVEAILVSFLTAIACYGICKAELNELYTLGLVVLAANAIKAPTEWATNKCIENRAVVVLKHKTNDLERGILGGEISDDLDNQFSSPLGSGNRTFRDDSNESASENYATLAGGEAANNSTTSCWALFKNCCGNKQSSETSAQDIRGSSPLV